MEIILPEQNYSVYELNSTIYTAVKGYIENIRLLKLANVDALIKGDGTKVTIPFPTFNQIGFDWKWGKDFSDFTSKIKTGDDLILRLRMNDAQYIDGLVLGLNVQVSISATRVRKSKKTNKLGYIFKSISNIYSNDHFVAKIVKLPGLYANSFLMSNTFESLDSDPSYQSKIYSYEDTQVRQNRYIYVSNSMHGLFHIPEGQVKGIKITEDSPSKIQLPINTPITLIPIEFKDTSPAFASFVQKLKRN